MCLIAFSFLPDRADDYLVLAANRDEFHERPTRPMTWWAWPDGPLAGRDERAGGTWFAVARDGRWTAVTNFRDPSAPAGDRSRGELPVEFLARGLAPQAYALEISARCKDYGPFNLLAGDRDSLWYASSHAPARPVSPGVHALSNGVLDADWPKSRRVATALRGLAGRGEGDAERLFGLMHDREPAPAAALPDTGVGAELERFLSPPFIVGERYGTRSTTIATLGAGRCAVSERRFDAPGAGAGRIDWAWGARLQPRTCPSSAASDSTSW